jgi:hypothetical protein
LDVYIPLAFNVVFLHLQNKTKWILPAFIFITLILSVLVVRSQSCGQTSFNPTPRVAQSYIVGGAFASEGDFPWQV